MVDHHAASERLRNLMLVVAVVILTVAVVGGIASALLDSLQQAGAAVGG